jgi:hypothetical protein
MAKAPGVTISFGRWNWNAAEKMAKENTSKRLNIAGQAGTVFAQQYAPRRTGFLASTIELVKEANVNDVRVVWGNVTANYALYQEIGARGQPGKYYLRRSMPHAASAFNSGRR